MRRDDLTLGEFRVRVRNRLEDIADNGSDQARIAARDAISTWSADDDGHVAHMHAYNWSVNAAARSLWLASDTLDEEWAIMEQEALMHKYEVEK